MKLSMFTGQELTAMLQFIALSGMQINNRRVFPPLSLEDGSPVSPARTSPACCAHSYPALQKTCKQCKILLHWAEAQTCFRAFVKRSACENDTAGGLPPETPGDVSHSFLQSVQSRFNKLVIILWWSARWCWFSGFFSEVFFHSNLQHKLK